MLFSRMKGSPGTNLLSHTQAIANPVVFLFPFSISYHPQAIVNQCVNYWARQQSNLFFSNVVQITLHIPLEKLQARRTLGQMHACIDVYSLSFVPGKSVVKFCSFVYMKISRNNYFFSVQILLVRTFEITSRELLHEEVIKDQVLLDCHIKLLLCLQTTTYSGN